MAETQSGGIIFPPPDIRGVIDIERQQMTLDTEKKGNDMDHSKPTTTTENSGGKESTKMVKKMDLLHGTIGRKPDNSQKKESTKMVKKMDFGNTTTKTDNSMKK